MAFMHGLFTKGEPIKRLHGMDGDTGYTSTPVGVHPQHQAIAKHDAEQWVLSEALIAARAVQAEQGHNGEE